MQECSLCARGSEFKFPAPMIKPGMATYACDPSAVGERQEDWCGAHTRAHTHMIAHTRVHTHAYTHTYTILLEQLGVRGEWSYFGSDWYPPAYASCVGEHSSAQCKTDESFWLSVPTGH